MQKSFEVIDEKFESSRNAVLSYVTGFLLSIFLTVIPYTMVTEGMLTRTGLLVAVSLFAVAQFIVQILFFLHLPAKHKPYWNIIVFIYTILIVLFFVIGSMWIMYHLNMNLMGTSPFHSNEGFIPQ